MTLMTWNCKNFKTNFQWLSMISENIDIILLQETWLYDFEQNMVQSHFPNYKCFCASSMSNSRVGLKGRPYGGTAIFIHKRIMNSIISSDTSDPRLIYVKLSTKYGDLLIVNVYLPCNMQQNEDMICKYMSRLNQLVTDHDGPVLIAGDFNMGPSHKIFAELNQMLQDCDIHSEDKKYLPPASYTFYCETTQRRSWIDHCYATQGLITSVSLPYCVSASDHLPMKVDIEDIFTAFKLPKNQMRKNRIQWNKWTPSDFYTYKEIVYDALHEMPTDSCCSKNCNNQDHKILLKSSTNNIISVLQNAAELVNSSYNSSNAKNKHAVNGWNDLVRDHYNIYRRVYLQWVATGKSDANIYHQMCEKRKKFKLTLTRCRKNENKRINDNLVMSLKEKSFQKFWSRVKQGDKGEAQPLSCTVDGVEGESDICEHWGGVYKKLFSEVKSNDNLAHVNNYIQMNKSNTEVRFSPSDIFESIKILKCNKAVGSDLLQAEHLKYAGQSLLTPLCDLINAMISHSFIPDSVMRVVIIPILKKKGLDPRKSAHYRPIALASVISKIVELVLLQRFGDNLATSDNQFGYKRGIGTELAIYTVKQISHHYMRNSTPVFLCYLDASKAFDRVNHFTLLKKLCDREFPEIIVSLLLYWFRMQRFTVRWGEVISTPFPVLNSVRQGGILSAYFFSVYLDDLSKLLSATNVGCRIGSVICNHICYADDICLMTTSIKALRILLKVCEKYAVSHDLVFNPLKSVCQSFTDYSYGENRAVISLNGEVLQWQDTVRYLGFDINCKDRDREEIQRRRRELYACANLLKSRFGMCSVNVKLYLFQTYFSAIYCSSLWVPVSTKIINSIRVAYNDSFRLIFNYKRRSSASKMFADYRTNDFHAMLRVAAFSMLNRLANSDNSIISSIVNSKVFTQSSISKSWKKILFNT